MTTERVWTREMPQMEGKFWVRTRQGEEGGIVNIVRTKTGFMCAEYPVRKTQDSWTMTIADGSSWGGYYWPVPLPKCPPFQTAEPEIAYATDDFLHAPTTLFGTPIVRFYVRALRSDEHFELTSMEKYTECKLLDHVKECARAHEAIRNSFVLGYIVILMPFPTPF